jgi:hypothetical protein
MRHVEQRFAADCGVAAAAMVTGCSYARALRAAPVRVTTRGLGVAEMLWLLEALSGRAWDSRLTPRVTVETWARCPPPRAVVLLVCWPTTMEGRHWLCVDRGGVVFDPSQPVPLPGTSRSVRWQRVIREIARC